jgi:tRNA(Ile)-lysidine synthase
VPLEIPGRTAWGGCAIEACLLAGGRALLDERRQRVLEPAAWLDAARLVPPLHIRAPAPGDRLRPLGMASGTRLLRRFLCDRKIPRAHRGQVPIVCTESGILWVVGESIDDRYRVTESTREMVELRVLLPEPAGGAP